MFSLGRKIDINYPSNKWLVLTSIIIFLIMAFLKQNITEGLLITFGFFLCWALAREIDPQHEKSAFLAGFIFVFSTFFWFDSVQFALIFWLLLAIRLVSKICGRMPTIFDIVTVVGFGGYLTYSFANPAFMVMLFLMTMFAWYRYNKQAVFLNAAIFVLVLIIILSYIYTWQFSVFLLTFIEQFSFSHFVLIFIFIITQIFAQWRVLAKKEIYEDDLGGRLENKSLQLALLFFGLAIIITIILVNVSYSSLLLLVASLFGVNLHAVYIFRKPHYYSTIKKKNLKFSFLIALISYLTNLFHSV